MLQNDKAVEIGKLDSEMYQAKEVLFNTLYSDHEKKISEKINQPGIIIAFPDVTSAVQEIVELLNASNTLIDAHNRLVAERDTEEIKLTDDVWATVIHDADLLIKAYQTDITNLNRAANGIKRARDSKKSEIDTLEAIVIEKGKNITSVQPTIDEIDDFSDAIIVDITADQFSDYEVPVFVGPMESFQYSFEFRNAHLIDGMGSTRLESLYQKIKQYQ